MTKDTTHTVKPFYRPPGNFVANPPSVNRTGLTARHFVPNSILQHSSDTSSNTESAVSADFVAAAHSVQSTNERVSKPTGNLDAKKLQDRITSCLALQAASPSAWAISMRLHPDLAPLSRFRLACNQDGQINLIFHSKLQSVVEAIQIQIPAMTQALMPWSTSTPLIEVELCTSVDDFEA